MTCLTSFPEPRAFSEPYLAQPKYISTDSINKDAKGGVQEDFGKRFRDSIYLENKDEGVTLGAFNGHR